MTRKRALWVFLALMGLAVFSEWAALRRAPLQAPLEAVDFRLAAQDFGAGLALATFGLVAWLRQPANRVGALLTAAAVAWFLGTFAESGLTTYADLGSVFVTLHRGPLFHAVLAYPDGRLRGRFDRAVALAAYATGAIAALGESDWATIAVTLLVLAVVARNFARSSVRARLALRPALGVALALAAVLVAGAVDIGGAGTGTDRAVLTAYDAVVASTALWLVVELLRGRWTQSTVTGLVVDLGDATGGPLRDRLAQALGDPSVEIGYRVPGRDGYVDADGRPLALPSGPNEREVTFVGGDTPAAVLVHNPGAVDDPALLEPVAAATRIAVSNVQLHAEVRSRLEDVRASRRRIVQTGDTQRRRLERRLRAGAQARLEIVEQLLDDAADPARSESFEAALAETVAEVQRTREELREFARGVHPAVLTERGLDAALAELCERATVPVELSPCGERFDPLTEAAAYFVCAEALANIGKYSEASQGSILVARVGGRLSVAIADDGIGGAEIGAGSGLRGLVDRVEALGGMLEIESAAGQGTRIRAHLPLD